MNAARRQPLPTTEVVDATLRRLAIERSRNDHAICRWLVLADDLQIERSFGYGSIREYGERVLGFGGRAVEDRLRVGRALRQLPQLNAALERGEVRYTAVREISRIATPESEAEWLAATRGLTATEVQKMVAARQPGDRPSDPGEESLVPRRVTLTLSPDAYALFEAARSKATREAGEHVDDSRFVQEMALAYLSGGGARDEGRAAFQIALVVDPRTGGATMSAGRETVAVDASVVEMAQCDAQHVGAIDGGVGQRATQTIPPRIRREVVLRHARRCAVPGCSHHAFLHIHHVTPRSEGGTHDPDELVVLCSSHHAAAHRGALVVRGRFSTGLEWFHADGRRYGEAEVDVRRAEVARQAFAALRGLGFGERESRAMLDRVAVEPGLEPAAVVRVALRHADLSRVTGVREAVAAYARCA